MIGVARFPITSREMWLEMRENDVTASVLGCLLQGDIHDYITPMQLWALKSRDDQGRPLISEDPEETPAMERGKYLEPVAMKLIAARRGWDVTPGAHYYRHGEHHIGATPDVFAVDPNRDGVGNVQVKNIAPHVFRKRWLRDEVTGEITPPLWICVQSIIEAKLAGCQWACVAAMRVDYGLDLDIIDIPVSTWDGIWRKSVAAVAEFWRRVKSGEGYPPDYGRDAEALGILHPLVEGKPPLDLRGDNLIGALLDEREALTASAKGAKERLDEIRAEIIHKLDGHSSAVTADGRVITRIIIDNKETVRKAYKSERLYVKPALKREAA